MRRRRCHLPTCNVPVPKAMLMCRVHWAKVPPAMQSAVWATFRKRQALKAFRKREPREVLDAYLEAARAAIDHVVALEREEKDRGGV